jgi:hypothetical protein
MERRIAFGHEQAVPMKAQSNVTCFKPVQVGSTLSDLRRMIVGWSMIYKNETGVGELNGDRLSHASGWNVLRKICVTEHCTVLLTWNISSWLSWRRRVHQTAASLVPSCVITERNPYRSVMGAWVNLSRTSPPMLQHNRRVQWRSFFNGIWGRSAFCWSDWLWVSDYPIGQGTRTTFNETRSGTWTASSSHQLITVFHSFFLSQNTAPRSISSLPECCVSWGSVRLVRVVDFKFYTTIE